MRILIYIAIQLLMVMLVAPLLNGIIKKIKAFSQKRKGSSVMQLYFDLYKLLKKTVVVSDATSWIFKATPYLVFGTTIAAVLLVPVSTFLNPGNIPGDFILLVSIFTLGRFFMMLAGLDTASTFGGMGSSREGMISSLIEPSILVSLFTIGLISKSISISQMMESMSAIGISLLSPVYIMLFLAFLVIIIAETARIPVDDPSTHLELTMVHEAMLLEYSGRHLALMEYSASMKQMILITLLVNLLLPIDQLIVFGGLAAVLLSLILYFLKVILVAVIIAVIEISSVKLKLFSIPNLAALSFILSFLGFLQYFVLGGGYV